MTVKGREPLEIVDHKYDFIWVSAMRTSQDGIDLIKRFESCRLNAYQDSRGIWTIGWGHTHGVCEGMTETQDEANADLAADLEEYETYVNAYVTVPLRQNQFDALVSFCYNLGPGTLKRSDLLAFVNAERFQQAADAFLEYVHADGQVLPGLVRRRQAERSLFLAPPLPLMRFARRLMIRLHR